MEENKNCSTIYRILVQAKGSDELNLLGFNLNRREASIKEVLVVLEETHFLADIGGEEFTRASDTEDGTLYADSVEKADGGYYFNFDEGDRWYFVPMMEVKSISFLRQ